MKIQTKKNQMRKKKEKEKVKNNNMKMNQNNLKLKLSNNKWVNPNQKDHLVHKILINNFEIQRFRL